MAKILGKVTASASFEIPRGADVSLRIDVPPVWLALGRTIEVELPRNLLCARCSGGGCSACKNSGAITLRGRTELPEVVQVVLPIQREQIASNEFAMSIADGSSGRAPSESSLRAPGLIIRIPECGGLPDVTTDALVRGMLMLEIGICDLASPNVRLCDDDEELFGSAKMLRAETRSSQQPNQPRESIQPVMASRSIRAKPILQDDGGDPPSSRVAPVGSTVPPAVQQSRWVARGRKSARSASGARERGVLTSRSKSALAYGAVVLVVAAGLLALTFF